MMNSKILKIIESIDYRICVESRNDRTDLLSGVAGHSLYFMYRYLQSADQKYHNYAIEKLEETVKLVNEYSLSNSISLGFPQAAPIWLIDQFIKTNLLDDCEAENTKLVVLDSIKNLSDLELDNNVHDLFYGFIGECIVAMEHDCDMARPYVDRIVKSLKKNAITDNKKLHWQTLMPFPDTLSQQVKTINLGIPHGSCGIILFLLKCCAVYSMHDKLLPILKPAVNWIIDKLEESSNKVLYIYSDKPSGFGKLGWCYGDLSLAYTLLRYSEEFEDAVSKRCAYELINIASSKSIDQSGVKYYERYGYFDLCLCHGTSSVAYMYQKMYKVTNDNRIKMLADTWLDFTITNSGIFFAQYDEIKALENSKVEVNTSMEFLEGLGGVGLVLTAFLDTRQSGWDKLLLLDRPGRD